MARHRARSLAASILALALGVGGCSAKAKAVDPHFTVTSAELKQLASTLPPDAASRLLAEPGAFLRLMAGALDTPQDALALVDKAHGLKSNWKPDDLVDLDPKSVTVTRKGLRLRSAAAADLAAMSAAARADGIDLPVSSTYRSYDYQATLWKHSLETQPREKVERELAEPGHSQHQLGTAIDFGTIDPSFANTAAASWLLASAWRYGYTLSFPRGQEAEAETGYVWEPWHYRWLGRSAAQLVHDLFADSQQRFLEFFAAHADWFAERRIR